MKDIGLDIPGLGVELLDLPQRLGPQLLSRDARSQQDATAIRAVDALLVSPVVPHRVRIQTSAHAFEANRDTSFTTPQIL